MCPTNGIDIKKATCLNSLVSLFKMQKLSTNLSLAIIDTDITIMEQLFPSLSQVYY